MPQVPGGITEGSQAVGVSMSLQAVYRSWVCFDVHENNCLLIYFWKTALPLKCHEETEGHRCDKQEILQDTQVTTALVKSAETSCEGGLQAVLNE